MMIVTNDGMTLDGTAAEIVARLAEVAETPSATVSAYMQDVASRVMLWNRSPVRTRDPGKFLYDLQDAGLILIQEETAL